LLRSFETRTGEFLMRNGLYRVEFRTQIATGTGVVVIDGGLLRGGDRTHYYVGRTAMNGDQFSANVMVRRHSQGDASVFAVDSVTINVEGTVGDGTAVLHGSSKEAPGLQFEAHLTHLHD
jgi:hypothetical protein